MKTLKDQDMETLENMKESAKKTRKELEKSLEKTKKSAKKQQKEMAKSLEKTNDRIKKAAKETNKKMKKVYENVKDSIKEIWKVSFHDYTEIVVLNCKCSVWIRHQIACLNGRSFVFSY